ncbi:MAG TPA: oligoendopeptidase F, partial [Chloroflexota bacterium]
METALKLPHWDMSVVYPSLESPEFDKASRTLVDNVESLSTAFEDRDIGRKESAPLNDSTLETFEMLINRINAISEHARTHAAYIHAFVSTDSRNDLAEARRSELQMLLVRLAQLDTRFVAWLGSLDVEALIERSAIAREHAFALRKASVEARHHMSPAEEELAAELNVTGGSAWGRLHDTMTSQIMVPIES